MRKSVKINRKKIQKMVDKVAVGLTQTCSEPTTKQFEKAI